MVTYGPLRLMALMFCSAEGTPADSAEAGIYVISGEITMGVTVRLPFYAVTRLQPVAGVQDSDEERDCILDGLEVLREVIAFRVNHNPSMRTHARDQGVGEDRIRHTHVYFKSIRHCSGKVTVIPPNLW